MTSRLFDRFPGFPIWPVLISVLAHALLLLLVHRYMQPEANRAISNTPEPGMSLQIQLRPHPSPAPPVAESVVPEPETSLPVQPEVTANPAEPTSRGAESEQQASSNAALTSVDTEAPVEHNRGPRLPAPDITTLRELTRKQSENTTQRHSWQLDCDEQQRRHQMIDCGENDSYGADDFAAAELNPIAEYFTIPLAESATQDSSRDLTSQESRSQAARQGAVGHLAGEQLRNSVMNVQ